MALDGFKIISVINTKNKTLQTQIAAAQALNRKLINAAQNGLAPEVIALLNAGADANILTNANQTSLDFANQTESLIIACEFQQLENATKQPQK